MIFIITVIYIFIALLVFGLLIFIHELGHFLAARACGVGVNEFAIGMGPKLFSWKSKNMIPYTVFVSFLSADS